MPRVERVSSTVPVPVKQAQLIDPGAFRFSTAGPETLKQIGGVLQELGKRKIEMQDRIGISNINAAMENAQREYEKEIIGKPIDQHSAILQKHVNNAKSLAGQQRITQDARKLADSKLQIWDDTFTDLGEIATIKTLERDAVIAVTTDYEKALTEGTPEDIVEAEAALDKQFKGSYEPGEAEKLKIAAEKRAIVQMEKNAVNAVHDAIEIASAPGSTGDFSIAKDLAKSPSIDGRTATALRSAITTAEKARDVSIKAQKDAAIDTATSTAIREYFGDSLTVAELNKRHEAGLIKDSEFKFMMKGLATTIPANTDPLAARAIRKARIDYNIGAISIEEAEGITTENYVKLNATDRADVLADLEDISEKIIATAESNAINEGRQLISRQFADFGPEGPAAYLEKLASMSDSKKDEINRQFAAEITNRDLYERAIQDKFSQMRKEGVTDTTRFTSESLKILLQYRKRKDLTIEELEAAISAEEQIRAFGPPLVGPPAPKPIDKMTQAEKLAELRLLTE